MRLVREDFVGAFRHFHFNAEYEAAILILGLRRENNPQNGAHTKDDTKYSTKKTTQNITKNTPKSMIQKQEIAQNRTEINARNKM